MIRASQRALAATLVVSVAMTGMVVWALATRGETRVPMTREVAREMQAGARFADSLARTLGSVPAESISTADAVSSGYLERLRLGLGSPFRLVDYALADNALSAWDRRLVAYAILDRTLRGETYFAEPAALALAGPTIDAGAALGARHAALIDSVVAAARDPRAGELTVRVAYRLAAAAGSVARRGPWLGTQAAALARDRALARQDVVRLLVAARNARVDPLVLLREWRFARRFAVERPIMEALGSDAEHDALADVPPLVVALDSLAVRARREALATRAADTTAGTAAAGRVDEPTDSVVPRSGLAEPVARRLAWVAALRSAPPQAPVVVAVTSTVRSPRWSSPSGDDVTPTRAGSALVRFTQRARNEETLAAEYALVVARDTTHAPMPALAVLWAAVSMRAYGQERVWFPGDPGPTVPALKDQFGLASVSFDASVPTTWRPYYLRMLGSALTDLQRVLPAVAVRGLGVHFGESPMRDAALAMHDPALRTVFLPIGTSAGVIAHELAHDLDWQTARTRYGLRGTYSTDRAVREYRDRLAASMLELSDAGPGESSSATDVAQAVPSARPTEVFARNVDWFVSAALARDGRMNGYLSAVQDGLLIGYGSVAAPEVARDGAQAMIRALDEMTVVAPSTRTWFLDTHGRGRLAPATDLARRVIDVPLTPADRRPPSALSAAAAPLDPDALTSARTLVALTTGCRGVPVDTRAADDRARLIVAAADARARGLLERRARYAGGSDRAPWQARALVGAAWDPEHRDHMRTELRDVILRRAVAVATPRGGAAVVAMSAKGCR